MTKTIPFHIKAIIVLIAIILIALINPFGHSSRGKIQNDFESWLSASKDAIENGTKDEDKPIVISLLSSNPRNSFVWRMQSSGEHSHDEKLSRLLQQAREAGVFDLHSGGSEDFTVQVKEGEKVFEGTFNERDITSNIKVALFLKLFEEFQ